MTDLHGRALAATGAEWDLLQFGTQFVFEKPNLLAQIIPVAPADAIGVSFQPLDARAEAGIQLRTFLPQQRDHFVHHRLQAVVIRLINVPKLPREFGPVFHVGQHQVNRAGEIAGGFAVIADGLARLGQFELAIAALRKELLDNLSPVFLQGFPAVAVRLEAGVEEIFVGSGGVIEVFDQRQQRRARPAMQMPANLRPVGGFLLTRHNSPRKVLAGSTGVNDARSAPTSRCNVSIQSLFGEQPDEDFVNHRAAFGKDAVNDARSVLASLSEQDTATGDAEPAVTGEIAFQPFDVAPPAGQPFDGLAQMTAGIGRERFDELLDLGLDADFSFHPDRKRP